jgi:chorismate mutase
LVNLVHKITITRDIRDVFAISIRSGPMWQCVMLLGTKIVVCPNFIRKTIQNS